MIKVALFAVNEDCEEREERLRDYITKKAAADYGDDVIVFSDCSIDRMVRLAKEEADRTIIVFDAVRGMNASFAYAARKLYAEDIRPILLISNSDQTDADISSADIALAEIWSSEDPSLESWDLYFHNLYFSYDKMGIDTSAKAETDDIDVLMKAIL